MSSDAKENESRSESQQIIIETREAGHLVNANADND